jgi:MraZ protein
MYFFGRERVAVDPKGRTSVPIRYRETLRRLPESWQTTLILVPWFGQCIRAYPVPAYEGLLEAFEKRVAESADYASGDAESDIRRLLYGGALDAQIDPHGRMVLPRTLRDESGISEEVYWTTGGSYLELWQPARLHAHETGDRQAYLRDTVAGLSRSIRLPAAPPEGEGGR